MGEGVLARVDREFLARRIHLAWKTTRFPGSDHVLLDFVHARDWPGRNQPVSAPTKLTDLQREGLWLAFSSVAVLILFVALLSMAFDFGTLRVSVP